MAKKAKAKSSDIIITKAVTTTTKPKPVKVQAKVPLYEEIITSFSANPSSDTIMEHVDRKFKGKDISTGTVSEVRGELFSLMIYLESNERYNREFKELICKVSEGIVIEGSAIRYKT